MASPFQPSIENQMLRALGELTLDLFEDGNRDAVRRLPQIAYQVASAAVDQGSDGLLSQATSFWLNQISVLDRIRDRETYLRVSDLVAEMAYYIHRRLADQLADRYRPIDERLRAEPLLRRMGRFEIQALKLYTDRADREAFEATWRRWIEAWNGERRSLVVSDDDELGALTDRTDAQRRSVDRQAAEALESTESGRRHDTMQLGAWVAHRYSRAHMDRDTFVAFIPYLLNGYTDVSEIAQELRDMSSTGWDVSLLERWELATWDIRTGTTSGYVPDREAARFWLALLLARALPQPTDRGQLPEGLPDWVARELLADLNRVEEQHPVWTDIVPSNEQIANARAWIRAQEQRWRTAESARIAGAPLDQDRIARFVADQLESFRKYSLVRQSVVLAGASRVAPARPQPPRLSHVAYIRKDAFIARGPEVIGPDLGEDVAVEFDAGVYLALADAGTHLPPSSEPATVAVAAIHELRERHFEADAVLIPANVYVRAALSSHAAFRWAGAAPSSDPGPVAYLSDVPVFDSGPHNAEDVIVSCFPRSLTLIEYRDSGTPPIQIDIRLVTAQRADELVEEGFRFADQPDWLPERTATELAGNWVAITASMDYDVVPLEDVREASIVIPALTSSRG
jgi:hypothetical protein